MTHHYYAFDKSMPGRAKFVVRLLNAYMFEQFQYTLKLDVI